MFKSILPSLFGVFIFSISLAQPGWPDELVLTPEKTNYNKTSTYADVIDFLKKVQTENMRVISMGKSLEGKDIPVAILSRPMVQSAAEAKASGKLIVYVQGNIHAGEVEGKEVVMMQLRMIQHGFADSLLNKLIILFAPIYNTDSNDRMAFGRRPSQENSPPEVGIRENSQGLDLNRDGVKMEALETNGLFGIINEWDPQLFVDLHTTNGTWHGWELTWAPSYHSAGEKGPYDFTVKMLKDITEDIKDWMKFGPFGDYDMREGWPIKNFYTYNHHPRYLVNQFGLRNRMAILSEAFSHKPFRDRIWSTYVFVEKIIGYAYNHADEIRAINKKAEENTIKQAVGKKKGVRFKMVPSEMLYNMPTYEYELDSTGEKYLPTTFKGVLDSVVYNAGFEAQVESTIPRGYVIPKNMVAVAENLRKHGIKVDVLTDKKSFTGEIFQIERYETAQRKFEGHNMATATGKFISKQKKFRKGDFIVDMAQPLGNLAFYLLEPQSDDGLLTWNFFDRSIEKQKRDNKPMEYPVFKYY